MQKTKTTIALLAICVGSAVMYAPFSTRLPYFLGGSAVTRNSDRAPANFDTVYPTTKAHAVAPAVEHDSQDLKQILAEGEALLKLLGLDDPSPVSTAGYSSSSSSPSRGFSETGGGLTPQLSGLEQEKQALEAKIKELTQQLNRSEEGKKALEAKNKELTRQLTDVVKGCNSIKTRGVEIDERFRELSDSFSRTEAAKNELIEELKRLKAENAALKNENMELISGVKELWHAHRRATHLRTNLMGMLAVYAKDVRAYLGLEEARHEELMREVNSLRGKNKSLEAENTRLKAQMPQPEVKGDRGLIEFFNIAAGDEEGSDNDFANPRDDNNQVPEAGLGGNMPTEYRIDTQDNLPPL